MRRADQWLITRVDGANKIFDRQLQRINELHPPITIAKIDVVILHVDDASHDSAVETILERPWLRLSPGKGKSALTGAAA